ncbi:MAG: hypothetical protein ACR2GT_13190 [Gaiellaceae bacterium]
MSDWTDRNEHDPGVTLLELLVWLAGALSLALGLYVYFKRRDSRSRVGWPPR